MTPASFELAVGPAHGVLVAAGTQGFSPPQVYAVGAVIVIVAVVIAALIGRRSGRRALSQRLTALGSRLGIEAPSEDSNIETALAYLEQVTGAATEAVAESSADAIRLRRSLDTLPQGVVLCDESGTVVYRNARANSLMTSRHGDALAAQAVTELLEDAWDQGTAERTLDLYGPPRRTLTVRARLIDDGRRPLGVIAMIEDVSERRRLEEIRRDFVANVSHELKTPMGALGLLAETLVSEPDTEVARRLASRIQTEAFRVSRIIDDLLDLSRIESEEAPPREPVLVNLVMAEAVERVRATADQRAIAISLTEPEPPVAVLGDRRQLVSAMHALLENAVTYSYDGSTVTVSGRVSKATLEPSGEPAPGGPGAAGLAPVASTVISTSAAVSSSVVGPLAAAPAGPAGVGPGESRSDAGTPPTGTPPVGTPPIEGAGTGSDGATPNGAAPTGAPPNGAAPNGAAPGSIAVTGATAGEPAPGGTVAGGTDARPPVGATRVGPGAGGWEGGAEGGPMARDGDRDGATRPATVGPPPGPGTRDGRTGPPATVGVNGAHSAQVDTAPRRTAKDTVRLTVVDHGIGIPARDLDRIFERFYRVDHGRSRETGGTGLGLSIVRHVANNHQGWVEVESREGEGSTFTLVLPLQPDRAS